jgi:hypothetical protein
MTREEYKIYLRKYRSIEDLRAEPSLQSMILLQDAALRAFMGESGYERIWEEETRARISRQKTLAKLPRHAG